MHSIEFDYIRKFSSNEIPVMLNDNDNRYPVHLVLVCGPSF
jgi:hypothetical protein